MKTNSQVAETNKTIIREAFARWTNATGSFFDLLTDDMRWEITGSASLSKTYTGKQSFMDQVIVPLNQRLSQKIKPTVRYLFAENDWVIALWDGKATATDGQPYNMSYAWFMQMKDGRIFNVVAFLDGIRFNDILQRIPVQ
ncbi:MAG: nuclear transport factor 2 family protein [Chitinophagaceae bacterium]|nr:MAG: nuclear transport factor 2 family protein [Chitinophagaceae bacterium]